MESEEAVESAPQEPDVLEDFASVIVDVPDSNVDPTDAVPLAENV
jgi:hypothetical protein